MFIMEHNRNYLGITPLKILCTREHLTLVTGFILHLDCYAQFVVLIS